MAAAAAPKHTILLFYSADDLLCSVFRGKCTRRRHIYQARFRFSQSQIQAPNPNTQSWQNGNKPSCTTETAREPRVLRPFFLLNPGPTVLTSWLSVEEKMVLRFMAAWICLRPAEVQASGALQRSEVDSVEADWPTLTAASIPSPGLDVAVCLI